MSRRPSATIFVGNLPFDITEQALTDLFSTAGPVKSMRLVTDRETGRFKGFGFCEFYDVATAESAFRNLSGHDINGRSIRIDFAEDFQTKGGREKDDRSDRRPAPNEKLIGNQAAAMSAAQVTALLGGPASNDREVQEQVNKAFAAMSKAQLYEVMREIKNLITQDKPGARQYFADRPGLTKALFQGQILLGMVKAPVVTLPPPAATAADAAMTGAPMTVPSTAGVMGYSDGTYAVAAPGGFGPPGIQEGPIGLGPRPMTNLMSGPPPPPPRPSAAGGQLGLGSSHPAGATGAPPPPPRVMMTSAAPQQQPQPQQQQQQPGMMTMPGVMQQPMMVIQQQPVLDMQPQQQQQPGMMTIAGMPGQQHPMAGHVAMDMSSVGLQPQPVAMQLQPAPVQQQMQPVQMQQQPLQQQQPSVGASGGGIDLSNPDATAALLRQVNSMTDEQINVLPPEYRQQVLFVKEQIRLGVIKVE